MLASQYDNIEKITTQKRFSATDIENIDVAYGLEDFFDLLKGQLFGALFRICLVEFPDGACPASGLACIGNGKRQIDRAAAGRGKSHTAETVLQHVRQQFFKVTQSVPLVQFAVIRAIPSFVVQFGFSRQSLL
jgi:hypothetical protein